MKADEIKRIAMVGAGLMGHSMAQQFALAGFEVVLHARHDETLHKARREIEANLERLVGLGSLSKEKAAAVPGRLHDSTRLAEAVDGADVVFESVFEDFELKRRLFREMEAASPAHAILASNTSSLRMSEFAADSKRPDKLVMTHYFNPPHLVPLVEVVRAHRTSDETVATMVELLTRVGKRPVVVQREVPGFIANRLQAALFREALWLVQKGIASAADVDTVIKTSIGRRWAAAGIFEVWEIAGWDLVLAAVGGLLPELESSTEMPPLLGEMVERGDLGVKSGKGFYEWTPETAEALKRRIAEALVKIDEWERPAGGNPETP